MILQHKTQLGGSLNLFFRPKHTVVRSGDGSTRRAFEDEFIVQWEGDPEFDSGYLEDAHWTLLAAAATFFNRSI
jgi:hypothetical protein